MTASMLGYRAPADVTKLIGHTFNDETQMHANLYESADGVLYYVGTDHDAVGLVLWWSVPTLEEGQALIQRYAEVEISEVEERLSEALEGTSPWEA